MIAVLVILAILTIITHGQFLIFLVPLVLGFFLLGIIL